MDTKSKVLLTGLFSIIYGLYIYEKSKKENAEPQGQLSPPANQREYQQQPIQQPTPPQYYNYQQPVYQHPVYQQPPVYPVQPQQVVYQQPPVQQQPDVQEQKQKATQRSTKKNDEEFFSSFVDNEETEEERRRRKEEKKKKKEEKKRRKVEKEVKKKEELEELKDMVDSIPHLYDNNVDWDAIKSFDELDFYDGDKDIHEYTAPQQKLIVLAMQKEKHEKVKDMNIDFDVLKFLIEGVDNDNDEDEPVEVVDPSTYGNFEIIKKDKEDEYNNIEGEDFSVVDYYGQNFLLLIGVKSFKEMRLNKKKYNKYIDELNSVGLIDDGKAALAHKIANGGSVNDIKKLFEDIPKINYTLKELQESAVNHIKYLLEVDLPTRKIDKEHAIAIIKFVRKSRIYDEVDYDYFIERVKDYEYEDEKPTEVLKNDDEEVQKILPKARAEFIEKDASGEEFEDDEDENEDEEGDDSFLLIAMKSLINNKIDKQTYLEIVEELHANGETDDDNNDLAKEFVNNPFNQRVRDIKKDIEDRLTQEDVEEMIEDNIEYIFDECKRSEMSKEDGILLLNLMKKANATEKIDLDAKIGELESALGNHRPDIIMLAAKSYLDKKINSKKYLEFINKLDYLGLITRDDKEIAYGFLYDGGRDREFVNGLIDKTKGQINYEEIAIDIYLTVEERMKKNTIDDVNGKWLIDFLIQNGLCGLLDEIDMQAMLAEKRGIKKT